MRNPCCRGFVESAHGCLLWGLRCIALLAKYDRIRSMYIMGVSDVSNGVSENNELVGVGRVHFLFLCVGCWAFGALCRCFSNHLVVES